MTGRNKRYRRRARKKWIGAVLCLAAVLAATTSLAVALDRPAAPKGGREAAVQETVRMVRAGAQAAAADQTAAAQLAAAAQEAEAAEKAEAEAAAQKAEAAQNGTYFSDAVFIGDSRTEALYLYGGMKEGDYFYATGATVLTVMEKATQKTAQGKKTIMDAAKAGAYTKVYLMLGVNELGWPYPENFVTEYGKVIDRAGADHPDAKIAVQSILPVSAYEAGRRGYVNNERIDMFNGLLKDLAEEKGCAYLDVASALKDENGALPKDLTADGVHPNKAGCQKWLEYLRENPL